MKLILIYACICIVAICNFANGQTQQLDAAKQKESQFDKLARAMKQMGDDNATKHRLLAKNEGRTSGNSQKSRNQKNGPTIEGVGRYFSALFGQSGSSSLSNSNRSNDASRSRGSYKSRSFLETYNSPPSRTNSSRLMDANRAAEKAVRRFKSRTAGQLGVYGYQWRN